MRITRHARNNTHGPLAEFAQQFDLDLEELLAAARAALAMPDREVTIDVERATARRG